MQLTPTYHVIRNVYKPRQKVKTQDMDELAQFIFRVVEKHTGITKEQMCKKKPTTQVANAKRIFAMLFYNYSTITLKLIGLYLNGADHATIINLHTTLNDLIIRDKEYKQLYEDCEYSVSLVKNKVRFK